MLACTGYGAADTHAKQLSNGAANTSPMAGKNYSTIDMSDVYELIRNPANVIKEKARWAIFSSYNKHDARSHRQQLEAGMFCTLVVDIDTGNPSLEQVKTSLATVLGTACAIYSTKSATESDRRWRVLVPLAEPVDGKTYVALQTALCDGLAYAGLSLDDTMKRAAQIFYLPNKGEYYEYDFVSAPVLDAAKHPIGAYAKKYIDLVHVATTTTKQEGNRSFLGAFRRKHSIEDLLLLYGYKRAGMSDNWRSPYQQSSSFATKNLGDGWFSLSASDAAANLGRPAPGGRYGDQFDLYVHFNCNGDTAAAEQYARRCLEEEEEARFGAATVEHGKQVWDAICKARAAEAVSRANQIITHLALKDDEGNNNEWNIEWPPGLLGQVAQWIYASSSRPVKQYAIAGALYFFSVAGRKFNVDGKGLNLYMMLVGGTGRGKGVVKSAIDRLVQSIVDRSEDPALAGPFAYEVAVSESGFRKALGKQNPICAYEEELGLTLLPLTSPRASANDIGLRKILTRLFDSGAGVKLGIRQASSIENTKELVHMPCFTLMGDTQPHIFRGLLGNGMLDTGFAPRMVPFFYYGKRSYHNETSEVYRHPDKGMVDSLRVLLEFCLRSSDAVADIPWTTDAKKQHAQLDIDYTDRINSGEVGAEMYNRAGMIVARVAGLIAIGINHISPQITEAVYLYAKKVVWAGLRESQKILETGGGGQGEGTRMYHLRDAIKDFLVMNPDTKIRTYKTPKAVVDQKIINERFFFVRFKGMLDFAAEGATRTTEQNIRETIEEALKQDILEIAPELILDKRTKQRMFRIGAGF